MLGLVFVISDTNFVIRKNFMGAYLESKSNYKLVNAFRNSKIVNLIFTIFQQAT